ncbi:hypothetical protein CBR_g4210 [Chara braunii]|uniref:Reverse transcriptase n=1 Tax=Chara braunii TaxID=69332 RepID=A0A388JR56_CHABU|nr:hypothetical protein CBR_g4210 [Chara braunii]|eukprot:GBG60257.1 hypothetical protein CBR_g4210 [Chara braunii]
MEKKSSEWVAGLTLGEDEEALMYVPKDDQEAAVQEWEAKKDPLKPQVFEDEKRMEWKFRLTRERKRRMEAATEAAKELEEIGKQKDQMAVQVYLLGKVEIMAKNVERLAKIQEEQLLFGRGQDIVVRSIRSGLRDFARELAMQVGSHVTARLEGTEQYCVGAIEGAKLTAPKEEEARPRREPVKVKFPDSCSGKKEENFDNWEANVKAYVHLQKVSPDEQVLIAIYALKEEAASFARSLVCAANCSDDVVAYSAFTPLADVSRSVRASDRLQTIHSRQWRSAKALKGVMDELVVVPDHGVTETQLVNLFYRAMPESLHGHFFGKSQQPTITYDALSKEVVAFEARSVSVSTFWHKDLDTGKRWKGRTISGQVKTKDSLILTLDEGSVNEIPYDQIEWGLENVDSDTSQGRTYATVLEKLREANFKINAKKCEWAKTQVLYLGHVLDGDGIKPEDSKIAAIRDCPTPRTLTELRSFLGPANYYRKFVRNFSTIAAPLRRLLRKETIWKWDKDSTSAMKKLRQALIEYPVLKMVDPSLRFVITTNASQYGIGVVLQQDNGNGYRPVEFMSARMPSEKVATSTYERELYALRQALEHWKHYLLGRHFKVYSDRETLRWLKTQAKMTPKRTRWATEIDQYDFELKPIKGKYNVVADALSRRADYFGAIVHYLDIGRDLQQNVSEAYAQDPIYSDLLKRVKEAPETEPDYRTTDGLLFEKTNVVDRLCIPNIEEIHGLILGECHNTEGHFGWQKTLANLMHAYTWPGVKNDCIKYVRSCKVCQRNKTTTRAPLGLLRPLPIPDQPGDSVSIDFMDAGVKSRHGKRQVMVLVDRFSKPPIAHVSLGPDGDRILFRRLRERQQQQRRARAAEASRTLISEAGATAAMATSAMVTSAQPTSQASSSGAVGSTVAQTVSRSRGVMASQAAVSTPEDVAIQQATLQEAQLQRALGEIKAEKEKMIRRRARMQRRGADIEEFETMDLTHMDDDAKVVMRALLGVIEMQEHQTTILQDIQQSLAVLAGRAQAAPSPAGPSAWPVPYPPFYVPPMTGVSPYVAPSTVAIGSLGMPLSGGVTAGSSLQVPVQTMFTQRPSQVAVTKQHAVSQFVQPQGTQPQQLAQQPVSPGVVEREVVHAIEIIPGSSIPRGRIYQMSPGELDELRRQLKELVEKGWIRSSVSPYGSPVLFVPKKEGTLRMCIYYRGLNAITVKNREPLPCIDDLLDRVQGCRYFSKIDLKSGYHQIAIRPEDQHKTAFQTRYGLYEFVVMPFGLCNAPGTFQHAMNQIFHDYLDKFVIVYLDGILIFSKIVEEHVAHLDKVLSLLRQHKFKINGEKCEVGRTRVLYLGHEISAKELKPDDAKVASIRYWSRPQSVTEMRSFLGMTGYYRTFVKNYSIVAAPLTDLTRLDTPWEWTDECKAAFRHLKHGLTHYEVLKLLHPDKPFMITTDASQYGVGGVLAQQKGPKLRPVEYMSKKMSSQKLAKSTYEKELYAVYKALTHWRHYLLGRFLILRTDHQTLRWMRTQPVLFDALKRWIEVIEQYDFDPQYLKGEYNKVVDALSRRPHFSGALITEFDLTDDVTRSLVEAYRKDQFMSEIIRRLQSQDKKTSAEFELVNGFLFLEKAGNKRLCVPNSESLRSLFLGECHDATGHFRYKKTAANLLQRFWWPTMMRDAQLYVETCQVCQRDKPRTQAPLGLLKPLPIPERPGESLSMDFMDTLITSKSGMRHIFVIVDRFSKYARVVAMLETAKTEYVIGMFKENWVRDFGLPKSIVSDRDKEE